MPLRTVVTPYISLAAAIRSSLPISQCSQLKCIRPTFLDGFSRHSVPDSVPESYELRESLLYWCFFPQYAMTDVADERYSVQYSLTSIP